MNLKKILQIFVFLFFIIFLIDLVYSSYQHTYYLSDAYLKKMISSNQQKAKTNSIIPTLTPKPTLKIIDIETKKPGFECVSTYNSAVFQFSFSYNHCYFGQIRSKIDTRMGNNSCGTTDRPSERISFHKSPLTIDVNQNCGILYESIAPIVEEYKLKSKTKQLFEVFFRSNENSHSAEAFFRSEDLNIEIVSRVEPDLYKDRMVLKDNINLIIQTMEIK